MSRRVRAFLRNVVATAMATCLVMAAGNAFAQAWKDVETPNATPNVKPQQLENVEIVEHLGGRVPLDATLQDSDGKALKLGDLIDGKRPTLFLFAYYTCPMLCSLVLDATVQSLNEVPWTVGDEFDVVVLSIDPTDTPDTATKKREQIIARYERAKHSGKSAAKGWHFLFGHEDQIRRVTDAVGFKYNYDARQKQYAHPAAIYLLTPAGTIARYLYGIQFPSADVRLGLLEASQGRSVSTTEKILLFCYHYDPQGKHYSLVAMNVMRLGGAVTLVLLGLFLTLMWARERRKRQHHAASASASRPAGAHPS